MPPAHAEHQHRMRPLSGNGTLRRDRRHRQCAEYSLTDEEHLRGVLRQGRVGETLPGCDAHLSIRLIPVDMLRSPKLIRAGEALGLQNRIHRLARVRRIHPPLPLGCPDVGEAVLSGSAVRPVFCSGRSMSSDRGFGSAQLRSSRRYTNCGRRARLSRAGFPFMGNSHPAR